MSKRVGRTGQITYGRIARVRVGFIAKRLAKVAVVFQTAVVGARGKAPRNIESPLPPLLIVRADLPVGDVDLVAKTF